MSKMRLSLPTKRFIKLSAIGLALLLVPRRSSPKASVIDADPKPKPSPKPHQQVDDSAS